VCEFPYSRHVPVQTQMNVLMQEWIAPLAARIEALAGETGELRADLRHEQERREAIERERDELRARLAASNEVIARLGGEHRSWGCTTRTCGIVARAAAAICRMGVGGRAAPLRAYHITPTRAGVTTNSSNVEELRPHHPRARGSDGRRKILRLPRMTSPPRARE